MQWGLVAALSVRLFEALIIRTAFAPDEYWQSIEVAHRLVFGYGHLTWEWAAGLRSYAHPLLFAAPYAILKALSLDTAWAVVRVPLLLQSLFAAATDVYVARLAVLELGPHAGRWCLVCQLASWFNGYCLVRTYSNSLEALAVAAGTYHWLRSGTGSWTWSGSGSRSSPWRSRPAEQQAATMRLHQRAWIASAALSVVFRPSSALFWALPAALELARQRQSGLQALLLDAIGVGGSILGVATVLDGWGYGRWVLVPWEFLRFNLLAGASAQYGRHAWHWNLTQGLPAVAASLLPMLVAGLVLSRQGGKKRLQLAGLAAWSLATYSLPAHKEFRFLLPALQLLMPYCGLAAAQAFNNSRIMWQKLERLTSEKTRKDGRQAGRWRSGKLWRFGAAACILLQLPMAAYFLLVHQGAQVNIMGLIRRQAAAHGLTTTVLFLTPCHATPYYSHIHRPIPMRFLDCSPRQHVAATARLNHGADAWLPLPASCPGAPPSGIQLSQRQCFERDPAGYLAAVLGSRPQFERPKLLVGYTPLMQTLGGVLLKWGYRQQADLTNCWVQTDDDSPCSLQLWACM